MNAQTAVEVGGQAESSGSRLPATSTAHHNHASPCDEQCQSSVRTRGTTNRNVRGSSYDRRARKQWLVSTYRANVDVAPPGNEHFVLPLDEGIPACRCYRCGILLTLDTLTVDRIIPGALGGTYKRENCRPCCNPCNMSTGGALGNSRRPK